MTYAKFFTASSHKSFAGALSDNGKARDKQGTFRNQAPVPELKSVESNGWLNVPFKQERSYPQPQSITIKRLPKDIPREFNSENLPLELKFPDPDITKLGFVTMILK